MPLGHPVANTRRFPLASSALIWLRGCVELRMHILVALRSVPAVDFRMTFVIRWSVAATADWRERGEYMLARHSIHPAWANEALDDPDRVVITPDPASKSGRAVRTIGGPTRQIGSLP